MSSTTTALATALALATAERDTAHEAREETTTAIMAARARRDTTAAELAQLQAAIRDDDGGVTAQAHADAITAAQFAQLQFEGSERAHAAAVTAHTSAEAAHTAAEVAHKLTSVHPVARVHELQAAAVDALTALVEAALARNTAMTAARDRLVDAGYPEADPMFSAGLFAAPTAVMFSDGELRVKVDGIVHRSTRSPDDLPDRVATTVRTALRR